VQHLASAQARDGAKRGTDRRRCTNGRTQSFSETKTQISVAQMGNLYGLGNINNARPTFVYGKDNVLI